MAEYEAIRAPNRCPSHPGAVIEDVLAGVTVSKMEIADTLGISRQQLHGILSGRKPLSPAIAVRVAKLIGGSPETWLRMQADYDAWHAAREVDTSKIRQLKIV
ncbi:MAG TPA: HigA family addiction module antitoxin [Xanthobacteraceae bacterium]|nr:HigA family addiction module antitoxin [Xanthobacteraceae bacterium]